MGLQTGVWQANDDIHLHMGGVGRTPRSEGPVYYDWSVCSRALKARLWEPAEVMKERKERGLREREGGTGPFEHLRRAGDEMANTLWTAERGSMQGNEGKRGSLRERKQMEESDSFNSLRVSSERQRQRGKRKERGGGESQE